MKATDFPYQKTIDVIFHDIDAMGHVNNVVYHTYLETVRIEYVWRLFRFERLSQAPLVLGEVTLRYVSPAFFGEQLTVGIGVSRFGRKSFDMVYQIDAQDGRLVATATTVLVAYDYEQQRSIVVPAWFRAAIEQYQGDWRWSG